MIRRFLPRPDPRALVESGLLLMAVVALGRTLVPHDPWLLTFNPHPFWAVLVLAAVRHGMPTAPLVGLACGVLHLLALRSVPAPGALALVPLWYLVVGVLLGEAMARARRDADHFRAEAQRAGGKAATVEARAATLEQAYRQVEGRLAGRTDTVIALYDGARHLASLDRGEILQGVMRLLTGHLGVERASIWAASELGTYVRLLPEGGTDGDDGTMPMLVEAVLAEGMVVGAHERWAGGEAPPGAGLVAGPLRADSARIEGVVVIEAMRFASFTPSLIREFELLLDWSSRALGNASRAALAASHTGRRATARGDRDEALVAEDSDQPALLLAATLDGELDEGLRRRLEMVVRRICRTHTRPGDPVTWKPLDGTVVMYLAGAQGPVGERLRERVDASLDSFGFRPWNDQRGPALRWAQVAADSHPDPQGMYRSALRQLRSG